jgi:hypothetical protein
MIKFFRHIRQRLLAENKTGRYLKYAIGEIILVVIGILIALQVNSAYEIKKRNTLEHTLLTEMYNNLRIDSLDNVGNIIRNELALNASRAVLKQLEERIPWHDSMAFHYAQLSNGSVSVPVRSAYENFKSIGFDLISNDSIRNQMNLLYEQQYSFAARIEQEYAMPQRYMILLPHLLKKVHIVENWKWGEPNDLESLMDDHEFMEVIRMNVHEQEFYIEIYDGLLELNQSLLKLLQKELGR